LTSGSPKPCTDTAALHTGIGLISLLIAAIEQNPHKPYLNPDSPLVNFISCAADFAPHIPQELKKAIRKVEASLVPQGHKKVKVDHKALKEVEEWWTSGSAEDGTLPLGMGKAMVSTTQATDIINGGMKVNALVSD
jgi:Gly-Xaa carboxypeptidase